LRAFVEAAHALDMKVIIDWVANHTAWDNPLIEEHPDWFTRDENGDFQHPPETDWFDVVDLNFDNPELRQYMIDVMAWWVEDMGIDGFRCHVAGMVPIEFWNDLRVRLDEIKPVFMMAEWETPEHHDRAFEATYAWTWNNTLHDVTMGRANANAIRNYYFVEQDNDWPQSGWRLTYVANHDQNAWHDNQFDRFGDGLEAAIALSVVGEGMPMVYNGQEAGATKMLEFFEKDPIIWGEHPLNEHFTDLFQLLETNPALWHGDAGGQMVDIKNSSPESVLSFVREKDGAAVFAAFNLSSEPQTISFEGDRYHGAWQQWTSDPQLELDASSTIELAPWAYTILERR
jgi:glycosidase